jgi:hypothetical protein
MREFTRVRAANGMQAIAAAIFAPAPVRFDARAVHLFVA